MSKRVCVVIAAVTFGVSCHHEGGRCLGDDIRCDGQRALVCIDNRWVAQRCKGGCSTANAAVTCALVDDPRPGEACYDTDYNEAAGTSKPSHSYCEPGATAPLTCTPNYGIWTRDATKGCYGVPK